MPCHRIGEAQSMDCQLIPGRDWRLGSWRPARGQWEGLLGGHRLGPGAGEHAGRDGTWRDPCWAPAAVANPALELGVQVLGR